MSLDIIERLDNLKSKIATLLLYRIGGRVANLGLTDDKGGDFKEYCFNENMVERVFQLKKNLDEESIDVVDYCIKMMKYAPPMLQDWDNEVTLVNPKTYVTQKDQDIANEFIRNLKKYQKKYPLSVKAHVPDVFIFHNGLTCFPRQIHTYLVGKDFIDGGAYVGDSALVFCEYNPKKIYSFDISDANSVLFRKTMELNKITPSKIELVIAGLGETDLVIKINDTANICTNIYYQGEKNVQLRSIDSFASEQKLNVGFIKLDIEGSESSAVRGMVQTIRQNRPVLSIAIYHNPHDFFEIKPYLESLDINYKWMIRRITPSNILHMPFNSLSWGLCHISAFNDTYLLGYPAELDDKQ
ncbi:MAG: FkbM family methyltransferase [Planctomycetaceae bacterium]|jgi:FkbM family methyltransferase|nr:FkbM family methyltransferase [Planctomycetaceae bacterium]